jgi:peptidoglycan/xylan/chitin deacetylase (PgdA/CDA1 family)
MQKVVALTFDDGPNEPFTSQIADIIESHGGKATFFVVGKNAERYPGVVKNMQIRGHQIGAHSYRHAFHRYCIDPLYSDEITQTKRVLANEKVETDLYRFPWLFRTPWLLGSIAKHGYRTPISGLFSHPFEPFQINAKYIVKRTLRIVRPGSIIIFHDGFNAKAAPRFQTVEAVRQITEALAKQGYRFVTIDELFALEDR